jgi:hypothetical protein
MAAANDVSSFVGNFKQVYGEKIADLVPETTYLTRLLDFKYAEALGDKFNQPVDLSAEHGITYEAAGVGAVDLLPPTAGQMQNAQVNGTQIYARAQVDYESMMKANKEGTKAFAKATTHVVKRLSKSAAKRLEIEILHGGLGWGVLSAVSGSSTTRTWTFTEGSWSAAMWAGMKNATLDVYAADLSGTKINSNLKVTITAVNIGSRQLSVSGNATDLTAITANMNVFPERASPTTTFAGINKISRNTGSLFGIDASQWELWKGNVIPVGTRLAMNHILQGGRRAAEMGLIGELKALVSPRAFEVLNEDFSALRRSDSSYSSKSGENGVEEIKYHGQTGTITIKPHLFQKDGQVNMIAPSEWRRIGAQDLGFVTRTSTGEDKLLLELPNSTASEMRCSFHGAIFCEAPAHSVVLDNITYS